MSLQPQSLEPIPEATSRVAKRAFPKGTLATRLRDELGPIYSDADFAHLFPKRGRPAEAPWRLALVCVLQVMEGLTDRQAAQAVCARIDWKYLLSLSLEDEGFDFSILSDFRQRLLDAHAEEVVLEPILRLCRQRGWLQAEGKQRTDSLAVLAAVRSLSSLESVGETMRASLNALARVDEAWLLAHLEEAWFERYVHRFELARFPKSETKRKQLREQVGEDVHRLLSALSEPETPEPVKALPEMALLAQIFAQHYQVSGQRVSWREGPAVSNAERIVSPYDPQARASRKRDVEWLGYKGHVTETCDGQEDRPHLIVQVETTPATTQDSDMIEPIHAHLSERDLRPSLHLVDQGYMSGEHLVRELEAGTRLLGPVASPTSWQAKAKQGYAAQDFRLDWAAEQATCPAGQHSTSWRSGQRDGKPVVLIQFAAVTCAACPAQQQCTRNDQGRRLTLTSQQAQQALEQRRQEQRSPDFLKEYAPRAGIEGTLSQGVRTMGLRHCRSRGLDKAHLQHVVTAAAINLVRLDQFGQRQKQGLPARPTRPLSPFAHVKQRLAS